MDGIDPGSEDTDTESFGVSTCGGELTWGSWFSEVACLATGAGATEAILVLLCGVDMLRDLVRLFGCVPVLGMAKLILLPVTRAPLSVGMKLAVTWPIRLPLYWPSTVSMVSREAGYKGRLAVAPPCNNLSPMWGSMTSAVPCCCRPFKLA